MGLEGGGHYTGQTDCVNTSSGSTSDGTCSGQSLKSPNKEERTVVLAGNSDHEKGTKVKTDP